MPYNKWGGSNTCSQLLQMFCCMFSIFTGKYDSKFFTTIAKSLAATLYRVQLTGKQFQHIITDIMSIGIIQLFEMVNINHGNTVGFPQRHELLFQCPP